MAVVQCEHGHYYDDKKFSQCPHCEAPKGRVAQERQAAEAAFEARQVEDYAAQYLREHRSQSASIRASDGRVQAEKQEPRASDVRIQEEKQAPRTFAGAEAADDEKTVSFCQRYGNARYTVGWLVCVEGEEYGRDFPLYAGFNRIGRSGGNDIVLADVQVSEEEHCSVIYEHKKNIFYVFPKAGNIVYIGDNLVEQAQEIKMGEIITVGETRLEFVPFCKDERRWENGR